MKLVAYLTFNSSGWTGCEKHPWVSPILILPSYFEDILKFLIMSSAMGAEELSLPFLPPLPSCSSQLSACWHFIASSTPSRARILHVPSPFPMTSFWFGEFYKEDRQGGMRQDSCYAGCANSPVACRALITSFYCGSTGKGVCEDTNGLEFSI